jgi:hypothetical protein|tara:strand:- start:616 stop:897 length:282 start_codon:yes stop_codon:yes gene_type:complete
VEVWDPKDKPTVFSQIKKLISSRERGLKGWGVCLYPGILLILVFLLFGLLSGCSWHWQKEKVRQVDPITIPPTQENTIACIKLQPECELNEEK